MKICFTQRLFWKQWPIKVIIDPFIGEGQSHLKRSDNGYWLQGRERREKYSINKELTRNLKKVIPNIGIRQEQNLSVFVNNEEELEQLLDLFGHKVIEVWKPENDHARQLLFDHTTDVVRTRPWYGKFNLRARILYTPKFRSEELAGFIAAVNSLDVGSWTAAGLLRDAIESTKPLSRYAWGQPMHLYLASAEDAAILKLQCGTVIERFERIRAP